MDSFIPYLSLLENKSIYLLSIAHSSFDLIYITIVAFTCELVDLDFHYFLYGLEGNLDLVRRV